MSENKEPIKSFENEVLDRLASLEHRMNIVMNEVSFHSSTDIDSNHKKTFLKGRVDDIELYIKKLKETFNTKAMHKEEHRNTFNQGLMSNFQNFEEYYNETFNTKEK